MMPRNRSLALAMILLATVLLPVSDAGATFPGSDGLIAFTGSNAEGWNDIFVMKPNGTDLTNLTNDTVMDWAPAWSPDGSKIAFVRGGEICIMLADGSHLVQITHTRASSDNPAWSPSGSQIAYISDAPNGNDNVFVMNADGSHPVQITHAFEIGGGLAWSPDGTRIAFTRKNGIALIAPDGTELSPLTRGHSDGSPDWSPDGTEIVFARWRQNAAGMERTHLFMMRSDGTEIRNLSADVLQEVSPAWSPDGTDITYVRYRLPRDDQWVAAVWTMNAAGSGATRLTSWAPTLSDPDWQPVAG